MGGLEELLLPRQTRCGVRRLATPGWTPVHHLERALPVALVNTCTALRVAKLVLDRAHRRTRVTSARPHRARGRRRSTSKGGSHHAAAIYTRVRVACVELTLYCKHVTKLATPVTATDTLAEGHPEVYLTALLEGVPDRK